MESEKEATLLQEISRPQFLRKAWNALNKANKKSRGFNTETIEEFQSGLEKNIADISMQLNKGTYKFNKVRGVLLSKKEQGKFRPLRIADVRDRLVCKAIAMKLDEILTPVFKLDNEASFAYRKEKGIDDAIRKMVEHYQAGYKIILEADIIKFFDNVNTKSLLETVFKELKDGSLNSLIESGLQQEVGNLHDIKSIHAHYFNDSVNGIPQGNALSPLFANVYLAEFDDKIIKAGFKLVRYADDFIILCQNKENAMKAYELSKNILKSLKLEIHELADKDSKTKIVNPVHEEFQFLSIRFNGSELCVKST